MTDEPLPPEFQFGKVVGRVIRAVADTAEDIDALPQARPATGTVTFTPRQSLRVITTPGDKTFVTSAAETANLSAAGRIIDAEGRQGIWLVTGTYDVRFDLTGGMGLPSMVIEVTADYTDDAPLDLVDDASYVPPPRTPVQTLLVPVGGADGDVLSRSGTNLAWVPQTAPDATTSDKGIVRLSGDLGGTAEAPTVPALADKADTTAVTSAINAAITNLINGAPGALDTLNELATQLGSDESAAAALTTLVGNIRNLTDSTHATALNNAFARAAHVVPDATHGIGSGDDTAFIQAALDQVAPALGLNTVVIHSGTWMVDAVNEAQAPPTTNQYRDAGLRPKAGTTLLLANDAILKVIPNGSPGYACISLGVGQDRVTIRGGQILGDRPTHDYTTDTSAPTHEFGFGICMRGAQDILIEDVKISGCTGDAVYFGANGQLTGTYYPTKRATVRRCTLDSSRRNNISLVGSEDSLIEKNNILNAGINDGIHDGTLPRFGVDIEGSFSGSTPLQANTRVVIRGNTFIGGVGDSVNNFNGNSVVISENFADSRISAGSYGYDTVISNNAVINTSVTTGAGIGNDAGATNDARAVISGNVVRGFDAGIVLQRNGMTAIGNYVADFNSNGIYVSATSRVSVENNDIQAGIGATPAGVRVSSSTDCTVIGNHIRGNYYGLRLVNSSSKILVADNDIGTGFLGVSISGADVVVRGNKINLAGFSGGQSNDIAWTSGSTVLCEANVLRGSTAASISAANAAGSFSRIISNRIIDSSAAAAVTCSGGKHEVIGNTIIGSKSSGSFTAAVTLTASAAGCLVLNNVAYNSDVVTYPYLVDATAASGTIVGGNSVTSGRVLNGAGTEVLMPPTAKRVTSTADTGTLTVNSDNYDVALVTALAQGVTIANPTGTPNAGQGLIYRIKDNGTARTLSWGSQFRAIGVTLPTTTTISRTLYIGAMWNAIDSKWDVIATAQEA